MQNNIIEIRSAAIRSWFLKRKSKDIFPYLNLHVKGVGDCTLTSSVPMQMYDWVRILEILCVNNTKDLHFLGCRVALKNGQPFAISGTGQERWVAFLDGGYYIFLNEEEMLHF